MGCDMGVITLKPLISHLMAIVAGMLLGSGLVMTHYSAYATELQAHGDLCNCLPPAMVGEDGRISLYREFCRHQDEQIRAWETNPMGGVVYEPVDKER